MVMTTKMIFIHCTLGNMIISLVAEYKKKIQWILQHAIGWQLMTTNQILEALDH